MPFSKEAEAAFLKGENAPPLSRNLMEWRRCGAKR